MSNDDLRSSGTSIGAATFNSSNIIDNTASCRPPLLRPHLSPPIGWPLLSRSLLIYYYTLLDALYDLWKEKKSLLRKLLKHYCDI